jgi:hypothetical protein
MRSAWRDTAGDREPPSSRTGDGIMGTGLRAEIVMALAWLVFPMVPVMLEELYYQVDVNLLGSARVGPDPVDWGWATWVSMLGPLLGYGFLAGATTVVPDDPTATGRAWRRIAARRAVWVAIGPWVGFFVAWGALLGWIYLANHLPSPGSDPLASWSGPVLEAFLSWVSMILYWAAVIVFLGVEGYAWLWLARLVIRRASRMGLGRRALERGVVTALAFVGSLFGSFWAITSAWRSFFFDPRVMPLIAMAMSALFLSGCAATVTYGEMRRRELFHAMLLAWVCGLAMIWWWSSRRRPRRPRSS